MRAVRETPFSDGQRHSTAPDEANHAANTDLHLPRERCEPTGLSDGCPHPDPDASGVANRRAIALELARDAADGLTHERDIRRERLAEERGLPDAYLDRIPGARTRATHRLTCSNKSNFLLLTLVDPLLILAKLRQTDLILTILLSFRGEVRVTCICA